MKQTRDCDYTTDEERSDLAFINCLQCPFLFACQYWRSCSKMSKDENVVKAYELRCRGNGTSI